jgi:hypothetical protein
LREIFVQFNRTQIEVSTDASEMVEYLLDSHAAMIATEAGKIVGYIRIARSESAFACVGADKVERVIQPSVLFDWVARQILDCFIQHHADLLWLHSAVLVKENRALLLAGPAAQGKSTLSAHLGNSGWTYFSDEVAPIRMNSDSVLPYPRTPRPRIHPPCEVAASKTYALPRRLVRIEESSTDREGSISWIVFLRFRYGAAPRLERISAGESALELVRNCSNLFSHRNEGIERIGRLALAARCYTLEYGESAGASSALNALSDT